MHKFGFLTASMVAATTLAFTASFCSAFAPGKGSSAAAFVPSRVGRTLGGQSAMSSSSPRSTLLLMMSSATNASYKKVFVAGGTRGVGRHIIDKLLGGGSEVVALVRGEEAASELGGLAGVTAITGDAFDYKAVEGAMDGCDAAITTLGQGSATVAEDGKRVDYEGNANVIEAAGILGVTRLILVTGVGCGSSKEAAPPSVFEVLKDVLAAKERAENVLIKYYTNMNWTIIRPGGLKSEPPTGKAILTEDNMAIGTIHREDVADLVVKALQSDKTERKILTAIDPTITSAANPEGRVVEVFALA